MAAIKEVETLKEKRDKEVNREEMPTLFMKDQIDKFEGLLKKVQNHREIVREFEVKVEEFTHESAKQTVKESEKEDTEPKVIYVQGKRQTIVKGVPVSHLNVAANATPESAIVEADIGKKLEVVKMDPM